MRAGMVVVSAALHVGLATGLFAMAQKREIRRRAVQVAVTGEKKKEAKPKPPPPPKPIARPAAPKQVAAAPKTAPSSAPVARAAAAAPVATNLTMSNADLDVGPGIGLHGAAPKAAPAPVKVASAISERRTQRTKEEAAATGGADAPCAEEPTKPQPVFKTEINYGVYPQAQQDGIEGKFRARLIVDANGEVTAVEVVKGIDPGLDAAIVASLKSWRFKPSTACGKPVADGTYLFGATFELAN